MLIPKEELLAYLSLLKKIRSLEDSLERAEFPYHSVVDDLPLGVYITDEIKQPIYVNRIGYSYLTNIFGPFEAVENLDRTHYLVYKLGSDIIYSLDELPPRKSARTGEPHFADDLEIIRDGQRIPISIYAYPWTDLSTGHTYTISLFWEKYSLSLKDVF